jgi:hypothetical protein
VEQRQMNTCPALQKNPKKVGPKAMKKIHFSCWQNKQSPTNNKM